jgi:hypothetical protein
MGANMFALTIPRAIIGPDRDALVHYRLRVKVSLENGGRTCDLLLWFEVRAQPP